MTSLPKDQTETSPESVPVSLQIDNMIYNPGNQKDASSLSRETSFSSTELSVSRNSSFSSFSSHNTTGSSDCFDSDSSISRSSSTRSGRDPTAAAAGLYLSAAKLSEGQSSNRRINLLRDRLGNMQTPLGGSSEGGKESERPSLVKRRSWESWESQGVPSATRLSSPQGLVISTPMKPSDYLTATSEARLRSKSESYSRKLSAAKSDHAKQSATTVNGKIRSERSPMSRRAFKSVCMDEDEVKRCLLFLEGCTEIGEGLKPKAPRPKKYSSKVTEFEDQVNKLTKAMALIPVSPSSMSLDISAFKTHSNSIDMPARAAHKIRPRSKSETRRPEFFIPDRDSKPDSYTCL